MIPVLPLRLAFTAPAPLRLPAYPGSVWRSAFGYRLRQVACITGAPSCTGCAVLAHCTYGQLFETPPPQSLDPALRGYRDVPHPFVLSPVHAGAELPAGTPLAVDLLLLPAAVPAISQLLVALRGLRIHRVDLSLDDVAVLPPAVRDSSVGGDPLRHALEARPASPEPPVSPDRVRIVIEHPLRLRRDNRYLGPEEVDFGTFFTALMRRISMLRAACGRAPQEDHRALAEQARAVAVERSHLRWFDWHRYSSRQCRHIPMGGVTGTLTVSGEIAPLWPWLWAGQWLHAGKGAVMGLGRYRLEAA